MGQAGGSEYPDLKVSWVPEVKERCGGGVLEQYIILEWRTLPWLSSGTWQIPQELAGAGRMLRDRQRVHLLKAAVGTWATSQESSMRCLACLK